MFERYRLNGLWTASPNGDYAGRIWLRDCFYIIYCLMLYEEREEVQQALDILATLLDVEGRPAIAYDANLNPISISNYLTGESADVQNDTIGQMLWLYAKAKEKGYNVEQWLPIISNFLSILEEEQYWTQPDAGMWEMEEEVRLSSIGTVLAGLNELAGIGFTIPKVLISGGINTINILWPNETETRKFDAAMLSLIWPFRIISDDKAFEIVLRIYFNLYGDDIGIYRFLGDPYYSIRNESEQQMKAEWSLFIPQMLLCLNSISQYFKEDSDIIEFELKKSLKQIRKDDYPESYVLINDKRVPNSNTPLAWSEALSNIVGKLLGV